MHSLRPRRLARLAQFVLPLPLLLLAARAIAAEELPNSMRVVRLDGREIAAATVSINSERRELTLDNQAIAFDDVRRMTFTRRGSKAIAASQGANTVRAEVRLRDGSLLISNGVAIAQDVCRISLPEIGEQQLDLEHVASVCFGSSLQAPPKWEAELAVTGRQHDRFFIATPEADSAIDGFLEELHDNSVTFEWMKEARQLPLDRLRAVIFAGSESTSLKPDRFLIRLRKGSRLAATSIETEGTDFRIQTRSAITLKVPITNIEQIECRSPRLQYLSSLKPEAAETKSILALPRRWRNDRSAIGRELQSDFETFERGLGIPTGSRLTYRIPADAETFVTTIALETQAGVRSDCVCRVRIDGREVARELLHADARSASLRINCRNGQRLELVVEAGSNFDLGVSANWCDASFVLMPQ